MEAGSQPRSNVAKQIFRKRVHTSASRDDLHLQEQGSKILVAELDSQLTWGNIHWPSDDFLIVPICGTMSHHVPPFKRPHGPHVYRSAMSIPWILDPSSPHQKNTYQTFRNQVVPRIVRHHSYMSDA